MFQLSSLSHMVRCGLYESFVVTHMYHMVWTYHKLITIRLSFDKKSHVYYANSVAHTRLSWSSGDEQSIFGTGSVLEWVGCTQNTKCQPILRNISAEGFIERWHAYHLLNHRSTRQSNEGAVERFDSKKSGVSQSSPNQGRKKRKLITYRNVISGTYRKTGKLPDEYYHIFRRITHHNKFMIKMGENNRWTHLITNKKLIITSCLIFNE